MMQGQDRPHWKPAYIGIGSNLESPESQVDRAITALGRLPGCQLVQTSSKYASAALGSSDQPDFVNAVAALMTTLAPQALLSALQGIEREQGRIRGEERWAPRTLDLDLLVYSNARINESNLIVPHPGIAGRNFVLLPLAEISPDLHIPGLGAVAAVADKNDNTQPAITRLD